MIATPFILLPGLDGTGELFQPFISAAPRGVTATSVAYPAHAATYDELAPWVQDKLPDRCVVLAESFSGPLAVRVASDPRVRSLVFCNSFVSPPRSPLLRHLAIAPLFQLRPPKPVIRWLFLGGEAQPALTDTFQSAIARIPAGVIAGRLRQVLSCDERGSLRNLAKPLLYLRGLNDVLVPKRSSEEVKSLHMGATVRELRGPHMLLQVAPEQCWNAILGSLKEYAAV